MPDETSPAELFTRARGGDVDALGALLQQFRMQLEARAAQELGGKLGQRVAPSDVVQVACLEAHRGFEGFLGASPEQLLSWLHGILTHVLADAVRDHVGLQKRDIRREQSMDQSAADQPALKHGLDAGHSTPSQRAARTEEEERVLRALADLPVDQAEAVRLRHLEGWPLERIAAHLGRSTTAAAGLVKRGLTALRKRLDSPD